MVTQPDRPAGRGLKLTPPPVKVVAQELGLPIIQPKSINAQNVVEELRSLNLDLLVVAAFGQLLRTPVLRLPRLGCVNVHASLLPKYRGAAPINWALIHGETETGVTTFLMDEGMDTGPILLQRAVAVGPEETAGELEERLAELGAELALETVKGLWDGILVARPQPPNGPLAPKLHKEDGRIHWEWEARRIHNLVRGLSPKPGAHTTWDGELIKIYRTRVVEEGFDAELLKDSLSWGSDHPHHPSLEGPPSLLWGKSSNSSPLEEEHPHYPFSSGGDSSGGEHYSSPLWGEHYFSPLGGEGGVRGGPGSVLSRRDKLLVITGKGVLEILELQPAGCRVISGRDFINGYCRQGFGGFS